MKTIISAVVLLVLILGGGFYLYRYYHSEGAANFRTAAVERGEMMPTIEATGTVEPEQVVDIGSQVNGLITKLKADYGSPVEENEVLALIDPTLYQATYDQNDAQVNNAEATLKQTQANLKQSEANLKLAQANLNRDVDLLKTKGALPANQYDTDIAACSVAEAAIDVQKAVIKEAEATIKQAKATRELAKTNLGYCSIRSPVKGTIVDRRVNVGQTVVSSLSASSLFLLAKDLSRIQVWASVNEADIGRIHEGMPVKFKVDAYPNETFEGVVLQIRLNATMTQNVVTYTVVVTTENKLVDQPADLKAGTDSPGNISSGTASLATVSTATLSPITGLPANLGPHYKLLPYMTASLNFEIERHENVLKVPNAALRWKPRPNQIAPDVRAETLDAMNHPKKAGDSKGKDEADSSGDSGQPLPAGSGDKIAAQPATSGGTASGVTAEDYKARTERNGRAEKNVAMAKGAEAAKKAATQMPSRKEGAPVQPAGAGQPLTPQGAKMATHDQPPGRLVSSQAVKARKEHHEASRLWVVEGNYVRPIPVRIIATDGTMTEVKGKDITEGMQVVTGENTATEADSDTTNPFMPKLHGPAKSKDSK